MLCGQRCQWSCIVRPTRDMSRTRMRRDRCAQCIQTDCATLKIREGAERIQPSKRTPSHPFERLTVVRVRLCCCSVENVREDVVSCIARWLSQSDCSMRRRICRCKGKRRVKLFGAAESKSVVEGAFQRCCFRTQNARMNLVLFEGFLPDRTQRFREV